MLKLILITVTIHFQCYQAAVFNKDPRYNNWPRLFPTDTAIRIPVFIDTIKYDPTTLANIRAAITQLNSDLNNCIQFFELGSSQNVGRDFIWISTSDNNGAVSSTCGTVPGHQVTQTGNGQKLFIVGTPGACGNSVRGIMAKLVNVLGLRNEFQRPDRGNSITVDTTKISPSLQSLNLYSVYTAPVSVLSLFDMNSITMVQPTDNAVPGQTVVTVPFGQTIGNLNRLSLTDCQAIGITYSCPLSASPPGLNCQNPYL